MSYEALAVWSRIVSTVIVLGFLYWVFRRYLLPAVTKSQEARNAEIADAERRRDEARNGVDTARADVERAAADAERIRREGERAAQREKERLVAEAEDEGRRALRNAQGELERQRASARDRLRVEMIDRALARARDTARGRIDAGSNARLVESTIVRLERSGGELEEARG